MKKTILFFILFLLAISIVASAMPSTIIKLSSNQLIPKSPSLLQQTVLGGEVTSGTIIVLEDEAPKSWWQKLFQQQSILSFFKSIPFLQQGIAWTDLTPKEQADYKANGWKLSFDPTTDSRYRSNAEVQKDIGTTNSQSGKIVKAVLSDEKEHEWYDPKTKTVKKSKDPSMQDLKEGAVRIGYQDKNTGAVLSVDTIKGRTMLDFRTAEVGGSPYTLSEIINVGGTRGFLMDRNLFIPSKISGFNEFFKSGIGEYAMSLLQGKATSSLPSITDKYGANAQISNMTINENNIKVADQAREEKIKKPIWETIFSFGWLK